MELNISITVSGYSSYVDEGTLRDHLKEIAEDIKDRAELCSVQNYYRKVDISWDEQEDINLEISVKTEEPK